jgi:16S rRNA (cytosine967-C5)-methyltransferase
VAPARGAAFRVLRALDDPAADAGEALRRAREALPDPRDRALTMELVTGTLRWRAAIDYQLARRMTRSLAALDDSVRDALRLAAYQIIHLTRVPVSAVVHDSVEIVKRSRVSSAAPFVNAVLRRLARERSILTWPERPATVADQLGRGAMVEHLAVVHSHPAWLVARWLDRYGLGDTEAWLAFNNQPAPLALAPNRLRLDRATLAAELEAEGIAATPTRVAPHGLVTTDARVLASEAFQRGDFVVQDEASQIVPELAAQAAGAHVLDACAAPGGKTLALAAQVGPSGLIVATDVRPRRIRLLADTVRRAAATRVRVVHVDAEGPFPFPDGIFDAVLIDAPCSGLGTLRRDPDIRWRRAPEDLPALARAQRELLARTCLAVRRSGRLIYSTCSSEPDENEAVIAAFLETHPDFDVVPLSQVEALPPAIASLATPEGYLRTTPLNGLEAFFGAVLQRAG